MTVRRAFTIIALSSLLCAVVGASIGLTLGALAPGYYRTVFRYGNSDDFSPLQVGVGLGLSQGLIAGLIVGCVVVLAVALYNSRRQVIMYELASSQPKAVDTPGSDPAK